MTWIIFDFLNIDSYILYALFASKMIYSSPDLMPLMEYTDHVLTLLGQLQLINHVTHNMSVVFLHYTSHNIFLTLSLAVSFAM